MELGISERIMLLQILPGEGDYITFKILDELKAQLAFSEEEIKKYSIKTEANLITWNASIIELKEIEMGDKAKEIIANALDELEKKNKINASNVGLYEKFVLNK